MRGCDQTPVKRSPRSQSSYCMSDSHASHLEQRSAQSFSHFLKAYLNSQTKSCCSTGTDMHTHTARRSCFPFRLENEHICNSHYQAFWGFSTLSSHRLLEASLNTFFKKNNKKTFFRRFNPVGKWSIYVVSERVIIHT